MTAQLLDGRLLAKRIKEDLKSECVLLQKETGEVPRVVNIILGTDASATAYANSQRKAAEFIGIDYQLAKMEADIKEERLIEYIHELNDDADVHGIMLHKPIPGHIHFGVVANEVDTSKDIEGVNVANIGKILLGKSSLIPCTPAAVMALIQSTSQKIYGKEAVIIGRSEIVGKPLSLLLLAESATVTICHQGTSAAGRLIEHVQNAEILVVAVGKPGFIKGEWVRPGSIVIDVGINSVNGELRGDVEFNSAQERAAYITPVPGGVGPVTAVMLMKNALEAFKMQRNGQDQ